MLICQDSFGLTCSTAQQEFYEQGMSFVLLQYQIFPSFVDISFEYLKVNKIDILLFQKVPRNKPVYATFVYQNIRPFPVACFIHLQPVETKSDPVLACKNLSVRTL